MENLEMVKPEPKVDTWTAKDGVGGVINEGDKESTLDSATDDKDAVDDATKKAVEDLTPEGDKDKAGEEKKGEEEGEPSKKEPDKIKPDEKKDKALEEALAKITEVESQMADMQEAAEAKRLEEEAKQTKASSEEEAAVRDALLKTPDEDLTETELKMKKYLKTQDARMDKLEGAIGDEGRARRVVEYQKRFDKIMSTHNKEGEEWLDENDQSLIASIALDYKTDDIEGIAKALVEKRRASFDKTFESQKQKIIGDYINKKKGDKEKTPVVEKSGDAPPPDGKEKLSLDRPGSLKKRFVKTLAGLTGKG